MSPNDALAAKTFFWAVVCGLLALVAPWIALMYSRWAAAAVAGVLALTGTILYSICSSHIPSNVNIRADVVIMYPLLLVAWLECIGLTGFAAVKKPRKTAKVTPHNLESGGSPDGVPSSERPPQEGAPSGDP